MGGLRHSRWLAVTILATAPLSLIASTARAQDSAESSPPAEQPAIDEADDPNVIIVIGQRVIVASLADLAVEDSYEEDDVAAYAAGTLGEVLDEIESEKGDTAPALLINGRPVADDNDITDLPPEAVRRIEVLPRGAAQRIGGSPGQRAYNIVLKPSVRSATLTASREVATEGGWANTRGEGTLTRVKGQDRANLTLRGAKSGKLFESERDFIPRTDGTPYSPIGNIIPASGTEVDPVFSAFVGEPVGIIGIPTGISVPSFGAFAGGANSTNPSGQERFRTLRGSSRPIDLSFSGNKVLSPQWSLSVNARLGWLRGESGSGLPSGRFTLPAGHPASPFSNSVVLAVNDPTRPLVSNYVNRNRGLSATLNGSVGKWRGSLNARWDDRDSRFQSQSGGPLGAAATIGPSQNPYDGTLGRLIPILVRDSLSEGGTRQLAAEAEGPLVDLWAGPLRARASAGVTWLHFAAEDFAGHRSDHRRETSAKAGFSLPLIGNGVLDALGEMDLAVDVGVLDIGDDTIHRRNIALNWQLLDWLRFSGSIVRDGRPIALELLSSPYSTYPNVPFFDPITGETVDVTTISGGIAGLRPETTRQRSIAATLTPMPKYRLQLEAEYAEEETRNAVGILPPPSSALVAAFPDRFQRDASGTLVLVDQRPINVAREFTRSVNLRTTFVVPLTRAPNGRPRPGQRRLPQTKLTINASHVFVLESATVLREGLPEIDLREGGAIGVSSAQTRDRTNATVAVTRGGTGVRAQWSRRGRGYLVIGTLAEPDRLTFAPIGTFDLKAFADLGQIAPNVRLAKATRMTLAFDNLFNKRERVTDLEGLVPQAYQPVRRDAVGRTVSLELRKQF